MRWLNVVVACLLWTSALPSSAASKPQVILETTHGKMTIALFADRSPGTVRNFLSYVDRGFYNGLVFHRVMAGSLIEGGGYDAQYQLRKPDGAIPSEANNGVSNARGTVAMARGAEPNSATSQFFINLVDNTAFDYPNRGGYCVFGEVIEGLRTIDEIARTRTRCPSRTGKCQVGPGLMDVPEKPVVIHKAYRKKEAKRK